MIQPGRPTMTSAEGTRDVKPEPQRPPKRAPFLRRTATSYPSEDRRRVMRSLWLTPDGAWRLRFAIMLGLSVVTP
ncbi:MAG: hypothetical protein M3N28_08555 [Actinomycetota bacterium]|nr:hypothetical protein [Actinomycetota bacterium]